MIPLTIEKLNSALLEKKYNPEKQKETGQIYLTYQAFNQDFPLFIRVVESGDLLQLLLFFPMNLQEKSNPDMARLLHLINKELDIPGFGMDEQMGVIFYRNMLPAMDKKIDGNIVDAYLKSMQTLAETFFPVIAAVAHGSATFEDILAKAKEENKK
jgi:hypothetical protein